MRWLLTIPVLVTPLLTACAGVNQLQRPARDFYAAVSKLSDAERQVLNDLNVSIARSHQHRAQADYLSGKRIDVAAQPPLVPQPSIDVRLQAVQAVQLYAQKLLDLTGSEENKSIDTYSEGSAKSISKVLPSSVPGAALAAVTAAFTGIANLIMDHERYKTAVAAAAAAQPHLVTLAALIRNDDEFVQSPLKAAAVVDGVAMDQVLELIRADKQVPKDRLLAAFLAVTTSDRVTDLSGEQSAIDSLVDAVVRSNAALASGAQQTFAVLARGAIDRAKDVYNVFKTVNKLR